MTAFRFNVEIFHPLAAITPTMSRGDTLVGPPNVCEAKSIAIAIAIASAITLAVSIHNPTRICV